MKQWNNGAGTMEYWNNGTTEQYSNRTIELELWNN